MTEMSRKGDARYRLAAAHPQSLRNGWQHPSSDRLALGRGERCFQAFPLLGSVGEDESKIKWYAQR